MGVKSYVQRHGFLGTVRRVLGIPRRIPVLKPGWYILLYHNVSWEETPYTRGIEGATHPPDVFEDQVAALQSAGVLVSVDEGYERWKRRVIHEPTFSFWFDDGMQSVRRYAFPILERYGVSGATSVCSRFMLHRDLFWCFQLSYLSQVDGLRHLRPRLAELGYQEGQSLIHFTLDHFSKTLLDIIQSVYEQCTTPEERADAFRLFETEEGLRTLRDKGWVIGNHTASHYPVGEDSGIHLFGAQYSSCESDLQEAFGEGTKFWVLPFDRHGLRSARLLEIFREQSDTHVLVLVGNQVNQNGSSDFRTLSRICVPICRGRKLIRFLEKV